MKNKPTLPTELIESLKQVPGFNEESFIATHLSDEKITSVRLNPAKATSIESYSTLEKVPWSSYGYYLNNRPSFTLDPFLHAGAYYVQEASSMFLEFALKQLIDLTEPIVALDACAAPGGKSTLVQSILSEDSLLVSNEIIKTRVNILSENITKWGAVNVVVTNNEATAFGRLQNYFDLIIVDAPCSGSGLFRKDPSAIDEWSCSNVLMCSKRQKNILDVLLPALKPGGIVVYSTCSYSEEENEQVCDWLMETQGLASLNLDIKAEWNIVETVSIKHNSKGYRFYPDKLKGEGFFLACFKKPGTLMGNVEKTAKNKIQFISADQLEIITPFIHKPERFSYIIWMEQIIAVKKEHLPHIIKFQSVLYIRKAGIKIGSIKQAQLIPHHELAMSNIIAHDILKAEVDLTIAQEYLRGRDVKINVNRKGWMVIIYNGITLGWVKNLGNRVNNYYPKEWRILNM